MILLGLVTFPVQAQLGPRPFSPLELERLGLEKQWSGQLPIDPTRSEIESFRQVVSLEHPMVVFEVEHNGRTASFSSTELNRFGQPLGEEGAKARAEQHMARLDTRQGEPVFVRREVPTVTFLVQSTAGMLTAVDGRTGQNQWTQNYGRRGFPQPRAAANDEIVAVLNDFSLYCLNRNDGSIRWSKKLDGVPVAGPAIGDNQIYVPLRDGTVIAYNFDGGPNVIPRYKSIGRITTPLVVAGNSVAWSTDRNFFYVGYADKAQVRYRIESSGPISSPPSSYGPFRLFFTTETGYLYCVYATDGSIQWRFSCGQPIDQSAVTVNERVYVTQMRGGLYQLDMKTGEVQWFVPRLQKVLAVNDQYVYCLEGNQTLVALDVNSGAKVGQLNVSGYDFFHTNSQTDRIILGSKSGRIVVLRSSAIPYPQVHVKVTAPAAEGEAEAEKPEGDQAEPKAEPAVDPFAQPDAPADPFAAPGGEVADPFGGGGDAAADPFGGGGGAAADPFGGGGGGAAADPFGGSDSGAGMADPFAN